MANETKWTPGPWTITGASGRTVWAGENQIAVVDDPDLAYDEQRANARLIAAAPDMAEALGEAIVCAEAAGWQTLPRFDLALAAMRAALSAAKGGE